MREITESAYRHQQEIESGDRTVVGVNAYAGQTPPIKGLLSVNDVAQRSQIEGLAKLKQQRNDRVCQKALASLDEVARSDDNTLPVILECVESLCTLGEICQVLRGVFGEYQGHMAI